MTITTLFSRGTSFERGEVEVQLLPGIPVLHVVGLPDAHIRESGIRLKSALKSSGFQWPRGHQIVVNLRPAHVRKQSAGVDLAVALGVLRATKQLAGDVADALEGSVVYGELALDGRVFAPADVDRALRGLGPDARLVTGVIEGVVREGRWLELATLAARELTPRARSDAWAEGLRAPAVPDLIVSTRAYQPLWLAAHAELSALVVGPQGTGKSTWARALHALSRSPRREDALTRAAHFGDDELARPWRPLEQPHHTTPARAMIGGGRPLAPGVITRAHGGVLLMDEFLEFSSTVLEALREPIETGWVELARTGTRERLPARFQLVATSNLCPCGDLNPVERKSCTFPLTYCRRVCTRLSGPVLDRFDLFVPAHEWVLPGESCALRDVPALLARLDEFRRARGPARPVVPEGFFESGLSHRRRRAIWRVARALADFDESPGVGLEYFHRARALVVTPMEKLRTLFA